MDKNFVFTIKSTRLDEHYRPAESTRTTTNFANLARGPRREENLRDALSMIDNRFNALMPWDNAAADRYSVELDILSVGIHIEGDEHDFPTIEVLKTNINDRKTGKRIEGIVGNNFSSYVRDYDFSILLPEYNKGRPNFEVPANFGELHGRIFKRFIDSECYQQNFSKRPVICLSVSDSKTYRRTDNEHPILGVEYQPNEASLTEQYFQKMGLQVRYFMPPNSVAPLAFYHFGDLLNDYSNLELVSTISTMETFQKIYRPEIYNANAVAGRCYQPNLKHADHSVTNIIYDREERSQLAVQQGQFAQEYFIKPYQAFLEQWFAQYA